MRIVGVIAEYNPFHLGHAHQLRQAREAAHADAVVAVMSGCFVQRGDAAIVSPAVRAAMALQNGADAVILLPALWSVRDAEHFALGGVHLLTGLGCDALSFGAETADLPLLQAAVDALESPDLSAAIQPHLSAGLPYPAALSAAMAEVAPAAARVIQSPNNTLGVCYLRALRRLGASTDVYPIARHWGWLFVRHGDSLRHSARRLVIRLFRHAGACGGLAGKSGAGKSPAPSGGAGHAAAGAASADG